MLYPSGGDEQRNPLNARRMVVTTGYETGETTDGAANKNAESVDRGETDDTTETGVVLEDKEETTGEESGELQAQ